jgi:small-conductance mechanosensitive channel
MSLSEIDWANATWTEWLQVSVLGNPLAAWAVALVVTFVVAGALPVVKGFIRRRLHKWAGHDDAVVSRYLAEMVDGTRASVMLVVALFIGARAVDLPPKLDAALAGITAVALLLQAALWAQRALNVWLQRYRTQALQQDAGAATMVGVLSFVARAVLWSMALLMILDNLGFDITTLVASLGIGGIAIALAVQNVLGDLFASLSIALDKPFVVGDFIIVGDLLGTVEHVGLKTTRVRSLSGEQLVFSNTDLLSSRIRNFKRMFERRIVFSFGVLYSTPRQALAEIPKVVRQIIETQEKARFDRAHFSAFGDSSLNFEVVYYVLDPDYNLYMDIQQAINLALIDHFTEMSVEFAFPTRTLHIETLPAATAPAAAASGGSD